jgi:hypothetical protein
VRVDAATECATWLVCTSNRVKFTFVLLISRFDVWRLGAVISLLCWCHMMCPPQFRAYVADLLDCLSDKSALVEELEEALAELREERAVAAREAAQVCAWGRYKCQSNCFITTTHTLGDVAAREAAQGGALGCFGHGARGGG